MHAEHRIYGFILGAALLAACGGSEDSGAKGKLDGGSDGASTGGGSSDSGGSSSAGGADGDGGSSSGGGPSGGGAANTGGRPANSGGAESGGGPSGGGTAGQGGAGGAGSGGRANGGAGGAGPTNACTELAACCPTAGILRPSCEQQVAAGQAAACAVVRGLFCSGLDAGALGGDAGNACVDLEACCATLAPTDPNLADCNQAAQLGLPFACSAILPVLCP